VFSFQKCRFFWLFLLYFLFRRYINFLLFFLYLLFFFCYNFLFFLSPLHIIFLLSFDISITVLIATLIFCSVVSAFLSFHVGQEVKLISFLNLFLEKLDEPLLRLEVKDIETILNFSYLGIGQIIQDILILLMMTSSYSDDFGIIHFFIHILCQQLVISQMGYFFITSLSFFFIGTVNFFLFLFYSLQDLSWCCYKRLNILFFRHFSLSLNLSWIFIFVRLIGWWTWHVIPITWS